jgi:serine/threonine protein kinase
MQYDHFFAGAYQMEKILDRSQYSILCTGKETATGQSVLLKLWLSAQPATEAEQTRIREEVAALQAINHPYLLSILHVYADAQKVFLVSPDVPLGSLNERLGQEAGVAPLLDETLRILEQAGQALQALHERQRVHGNITPQAIFFLTPDQIQLGEVLFPGILASIPDYQHVLDEHVPRCLYMAPEQFQGTLTAKTDQYALGCLAYILLTGRVPFAGSTRAVLLQKHQQDEPQPLTAFNPTLPAHIEAAVLKALAKDPEQRHQDIVAFLAALDTSSQKGLADASTLKQAVAGTPDAAGIWEWDAATVSVGSAPASSSVGKTSVVARFPGQALSRPRQRRSLAVALLLLLLVLLVVFGVRQILFSGLAHPGNPGTQGQSGGDPSTSVLLTPATQTSQQATATATVAVVQVVTPTPRVTLTPSATPSVTPGSSLAPTATASPTPTPTPTPTPSTVTPFLDCVTPAGGPGQYIAKFGYQNTATHAVSIPQGSENVVTFTPSQPGPVPTPPTSFSPGRQDSVFQVHFARNVTVSWTIDGVTATASSAQSSGLW